MVHSMHKSLLGTDSDNLSIGSHGGFAQVLQPSSLPNSYEASLEPCMFIAAQSTTEISRVSRSTYVDA